MLDWETFILRGRQEERIRCRDIIEKYINRQHPGLYDADYYKRLAATTLLRYIEIDSLEDTAVEKEAVVFSTEDSTGIK